LKDPRDILRRPIVSEKSYRSLQLNQYTFEVDPRASKPEISQAVEAVFKVSVEGVSTISVKGKPKQQRARGQGHSRNWKKAIVTLKKGDRIEIFEGG